MRGDMRGGMRDKKPGTVPEFFPQDAIYRGLLGHFQACGKQIHNFPLFLFDVTKGVTALFENTINPRLVC
jgi:hypothetical protein